MLQFDRKRFFDAFRPYFQKIAGRALTAEQVSNLEFLLGAFEVSDWFNDDVRFIAYALATIHIETYWPKTNSRYAPITEGGTKAYFNRYDIQHNPKKARELGNLQSGDGYLFRGRGYVQITGRNNYRKFGIEDSPELALDPQTAFHIMETGMHTGMFTGHKLGNYINAQKTDYKNARRVINGQDRAAEIAGYATEFEQILRESEETSVAAPIPTEAVATPNPNPNPPPAIVATAIATDVEAPAEVKKTQTSWVSRITAGTLGLFGGAKAIGVNTGDLVNKAATSETAGQMAASGLALFLRYLPWILVIGLGVYVYRQSQRNAHERLMKVVDSTARKDQQSVIIT